MALAAAAAGSHALAALERLDIPMNGIGAEGAAALADAMLAARPVPTAAAGASSSAGASAGDPSAAAVASSSSSSSVRGAPVLYEHSPSSCSVRGTPVLRELRLEGNPLGAAGARAIAGSCHARLTPHGGAAPPSLEVLSLSGTRLGVAGAAVVAAAMATRGGRLTRVTHLDLSANDIGESGALYLGGGGGGGGTGEARDEVDEAGDGRD